jgi:hypothetical protein
MIVGYYLFYGKFIIYLLFCNSYESSECGGGEFGSEFD